MRTCIGACLGAAMATASACIGAGAYACAGDAQCKDGAADGLCEKEGFCSFPDGDCPSGRRFTELAPAALAGECTTDGADTGTTGDPTDTSTGATAHESTSADATTASDETVDPTPVCGNGVQDDGEDCDDANRIDDDACNDDCRVPGAPIWEVQFGGPADLGDRGYSLAMHPDGDRFAVAGWLATGPDSADAFVTLYDLDGNEDWIATSDGPTPGAWNEAREVVFADDGAVIVAGVEDATATFVPGISWVAVYEPDGSERWQWGGSSPDRREGFLRSAATDGDDIIAVGHMPGASWIGRLDAEGNLSAEITEPGQGQSMAWSITRGDDQRWWIVGHDDVVDAPEHYWVRIYDPELIEDPIVVLEGDSVATGEAAPYGSTLAPDGRVWVCGTRALIDDRDLWLQPFTAEGREVRAIPIEMGGDDFALADDVAIAGDGSFVVTGAMGLSSTNDLDLWVWKYGPDLELRWAQQFEGDAGQVDRGWGVRLDADGNPVVVGYMTDTADDADVWIARLAR